MKSSSFIWLIAVALQSSLLWLQPIQPAFAQDTAASASSAKSEYKVVSPLGESIVKMMAMAPRLDTLEGKTVCLVWNHAFKADVTLPAIAEELKRRYPGIKIVAYTDIPDAPTPELVGTPRTASEALQAAFKIKGCDAVIGGNGGCGVCTPRVTHATVLAEQIGIPAVAVTNPGFYKQARIMSQEAGIPSLQVAVYPDPFDLETDAQLKEKSVKILVPQIIDALTKAIPASTVAPEKRNNREVVFTGTLDQINRHFAQKGWSDGLSITPPTNERVEEFLKYTAYPPDQEIAVLPPSNLRSTPRDIAVNGVMAGCLPEHMPILIAAVQSMVDPAFRYKDQGASTHGFTNFFWLNGPLARQLGIDHGQGLAAHPANAVIGRAMSLIERNLAGLRIKETQMSTYGKALSWILVEDEEAVAKVGWEPHHVEKGFAKNANTVSAGYSTLWGHNLIPATSDPKILMQLMAYGMVQTEAFASGFTGQSRRYALVSPGVAKILAEGGYTRKSLREDLMNTGRKITYEAIFSQVHGSYGDVQDSFDNELAKALSNKNNEKGKLPPWYPKVPGWEEIQTTPAIRMVEFIVCGDPARNKVQVLAGGAGVAITEIKLPAKWDELMEQAGNRPLQEFFLK
jgi:hypothetical protein